MDPVTLGTVGVAASAGGSLLGAFGKVFGGEAKAGMYSYQAGIARMREQVDLQNAAWAREAGEQHAMLSGFKTGQEIGGVTAKQGASGVQVGAGSSAQVTEGIHTAGLYDQGMLRYNAARKAYGFEVEAAGEKATAEMADRSAKFAKEEGWLGGISSLLGGATSVADKWLAGKQTGLWGQEG